MTPLPPLPVPVGPEPRLYQRIHEALRQRIQSGAIPMGAMLLELHVARDFAVSRGPARRALQELSDEGLIARSTGRGFVVIGALAAPTGRPAAPPTATLTSTASWERIYRHIARELAAHASLGRWRVTEMDLARHFLVSRTVAREVLARLQHVGIVFKDSKSRWFVPALTRQRILEFYELRWMLEPAALRKAAGRIAPGVVATMRQNLEDALARFPDVGTDELNALEHQLHVEFLSHCGNQTLIETLQHYHVLLIAHSFLYAHTLDGPAPDPFLSEHLAVVQSLESGNVEAAAALARHLKASGERAVARVEVVSGALRPEPPPYLQPAPEG